jgi:hypothetical protein
MDTRPGERDPPPRQVIVCPALAPWTACAQQVLQIARQEEQEVEGR